MFIIFIVSSLCSNMWSLENILDYVRQQLKKHAHFKISSRHEVFTRLFFFFSSPDEISPRLSSRQKLVNSKRHFTIDRDYFIPVRNFTCKHPLRNCNFAVINWSLWCSTRVSKNLLFLGCLLLDSDNQYFLTTVTHCQIPVVWLATGPSSTLIVLQKWTGNTSHDVSDIDISSGWWLVKTFPHRRKKFVKIANRLSGSSLQDTMNCM